MLFPMPVTTTVVASITHFTMVYFSLFFLHHRWVSVPRLISAPVILCLTLVVCQMVCVRHAMVLQILVGKEPVAAAPTIVVSFPISVVSLELKGVIGTIVALLQATIQMSLLPRGSVVYLEVTQVGSGVALCIPLQEYNVMSLDKLHTFLLTGVQIETVAGIMTVMLAISLAPITCLISKVDHAATCFHKLLTYVSVVRLKLSLVDGPSSCLRKCPFHHWCGPLHTLSHS